VGELSVCKEGTDNGDNREDACPKSGPLYRLIGTKEAEEVFVRSPVPSNIETIRQGWFLSPTPLFETNDGTHDAFVHPFRRIDS
jgi:hypothetical protein